MSAERQRAVSAELQALLPASPDAYPQNIDLVRGLVLVIRMNEHAYRAASFLDDRLLSPATEGCWLPGPLVTQSARRATGGRPLHFIFHTGHVGSTLLSRLLDETGQVLGLREPLPLRSLADAHDALAKPESLLGEVQFDSLVDMLQRLWARGYDWTRAVVVKATSSAGRIAGMLLTASPDSRAIYLSLGAEPYLATLLGGANSATDLRGHGPGRMRRLLAGRDLPVSPLYALSAGELAALGWLVESLSRADARSAHGTRVLALDFDEFLTDPAAGVGQVLGHFGLPVVAGFLASIPQGAVMRQYSKAPELAFPPEERGARLKKSRRDNREEIAKGLAWLERLARADDSVAAVLSRGAA